MPNPPISIGAYDNVPAPGAPVKSDWSQAVTPRVVHEFANSADRATRWPLPPNGALSMVNGTGIIDVYRLGAWRAMVDVDSVPGVGVADAAIAGASGATAFLTSMLHPLRFPTGQGDISMVTYGTDFSGRVSGQFTVNGYPVVTPPTPIIIGAPTGVIPNTYRGMVFGQVTAANPTATEVRVLKNGTLLAPTAGPDAGGYFGLDLSGVDLGTPDGPWTFQLYRSGIAEGLPAPQVPVFDGVALELHVVTDTDYLLDEIPADTSGEFSFPTSAPGDKRVALTHGTTLLAEQGAPALLRSYVTAGFPGDNSRFETTSYVYDQAVALLAALAIGDTELSQLLKDGLIKHRDDEGRFRFVRQQEGTTQGDLFMRTGAHAWAVYAWLKYLIVYPNWVDNERAAVEESIAYMMSMKSTVEPTKDLLLGGTGIYLPNGDLDPDYVIEWASTEHNVDAYWVLKAAAKALDDPSYLTQATALSNAMFGKLWAGTRLRQGVQPGGPDNADALDCHTWGATWLVDIGREAEAFRNMETAEAFKFTINGVTGYAISYDGPDSGYPGMLPNVWSEGTFGWVCAARKLDLPYSAQLKSMLDWQNPDGSWKYVEVPDPTYELTPYPCSIGAAWAVLAITGRGLWDD